MKGTSRKRPNIRKKPTESSEEDAEIESQTVVINKRKKARGLDSKDLMRGATASSSSKDRTGTTGGSSTNGAGQDGEGGLHSRSSSTNSVMKASTTTLSSFTGTFPNNLTNTSVNSVYSVYVPL